MVGVAVSQPAESSRDEVLITIPASDCIEANRIAPLPLRVYHRLGEAYLAGTTRNVLHALRKRRIEFAIVDDQPWSLSYGVVGLPHPGKRGIRLSDITEPVLLRGDDYLLVKCSPRVLEALREQGFVCIEIERDEIPIDASRTALPERILQHASPVGDIVDSVIRLVSDTSIRNYVQGLQNFGTRYWNNVNRDTVSRWVRAKYVEAGIADARLDSFQYSGTWQSNVVATLPGVVDPTREFIVGGHHDSYSSNINAAPGADDNASGTAAALEMARVLKAFNYQPAYTMRFMGFGAEEAGLRGSASYAQRARGVGRDIRAMLNYDMIGNRNQASSDRDVSVVWYTGSEALANLHVAAAQSYTSLTPILSTSSRSGSDSYSFWQQNYKSVFLIERDFSPYYHSPNDLLQYLDMQYCGDIVRAGLATLVLLDQMPPQVTRLQVRDCGDGNSLFAGWEHPVVPDFASYKIYVGRIHGIYDTSYTNATRSIEINGLTDGQGYVVGVSILDIAGRESFITEISATPRSVPLAPVGLSWTSISQSIQFRWRSNGEMDLLGYNIYRKSPSGTTFQRLNAVPFGDTTYTDAAQVYARYYVTAIDSTNNESASSDTITIPPVLTVDQDVSPFGFVLHQNYPNPFNPNTTIRYEIPARSRVELKVFDVLGREVATLVSEEKGPGTYVAIWKAGGMASGVYLYRLKAGGMEQAMRLVLLR